MGHVVDGGASCAVIACACGRRHVLEVTAHDVVDEAPPVALADGYGAIGGSMKRWARSGRLRAFTAERGKLVAYVRDIRAAVEKGIVEPDPAAARRGGTACRKEDEELAALLDDPELEFTDVD